MRFNSEIHRGGDMIILSMKHPRCGGKLRKTARYGEMHLRTIAVPAIIR
jgi:hypothetical protein